MQRRRLLWQLFPSYLLVILVSLGVVSWYAAVSLRSFYYRQTEADLRAIASLVNERLGPEIGRRPRSELDALVKTLGRTADARVTVILPSGVVLADSEEDPTRMDNHADRPEIGDAYAGRVGTSTRYSHTLKTHMLYVAVPVVDGGDVVAVVRSALPTTALDSALTAVRNRIILAAAIMAAAAILVSLLISRHLSRPIEEMRVGARRFAQGDLRHSLRVPRTDELGGLAETLNQMASDLESRIATVTQQRAEQDAVFASMVEGVIAVDANERIIAINRAGAEIFGVDSANARGRVIQEVVRNIDVQDLVRKTLASDAPVEEDLALGIDEERSLQAHGTALRADDGRRAGAVIVLNDVTRLRQLENVRRDFAANVSHELRTPITSIKGYVETLLDRSDLEEQDLERFLRIVAKHADRLNAIVEDLMSLSRIEQDAKEGRVELEDTSVRLVLEGAMRSVGRAAAEKGIEIDLECGSDMHAELNPLLFEHAVANLLDNAVKYSPNGSSVSVRAARDRDEIAVQVRDSGCGIATEHLPRIFERFYRIDKSRSRELGGTGLGLAIAKHIVQAHGGRIDVASTPGSGSTFAIVIPVRVPS